MDHSTLSGCHNLTAQSGDVDADGDLVDELTLRLRGAVGFTADDVDPAGQVALTRALLTGDLHSVRAELLAPPAALVRVGARVRGTW